MYQATVHFRYQNFEQDPVTSINQVIEQWRLNGQIIGREMGVTHHQLDSYNEFQVRVALPEQDSLLPKWNNQWVNTMLEVAEAMGVSFDHFSLIGRDYQAEETSQSEADFLLLYTTHLDTCSPIYNGNDFAPVPLYKLGLMPELNDDLIHWQENWQACDQLQMNGSILEKSALTQISKVGSQLSLLGRELTQAVEKQTKKPTYYYLYRLGNDAEAEANCRCPICKKAWKRSEPLHGIFHYQCHDCRLVSNLSWELQ